MASRSIFANLARSDNGAIFTVYGPYQVHSALQPVFRSSETLELSVEAFEGLVRVFNQDEQITPAEFFSLVPAEDMADIDSMLRTIHILNTGRLKRQKAGIFVKFRPDLIRLEQEMRHEVERIKLAAHEAGLVPDRIVCEISERSGESDDIIFAFTRHMRGIGFRVAIEDYGAGDADLARMKRIKPDYVKFGHPWVRDLLGDSAGFALLRVIVQQMRDDGIEPIFKGLEEDWQIELSQQLQVPLLQGYVLARPELAPTRFDETFPEEDVSAVHFLRDRASFSPLTRPLSARPGLGRPARAFGRRQNSG